MNTGGLPELIQPGENGWLLPMRDPAALAAEIERVAATPSADLLPMRVAAHETARANYTWEIAARKTEEVYFDALQKCERQKPGVS